MLAIHGAGGGYDQGLLIARDIGEAFRVIAPSRFVRFTDERPAHARQEEEILYPTAIVVGRYVAATAPR